MKIEDVKSLYPEFKYFKGVYTQLNFTANALLYLTGSSDGVRIQYARLSDFSIISGKLDGSTELIKWLKTGKTILMNVSDMAILGKTLKKNVKSVEYNNHEFKYIFQDSNGFLTELAYNAILPPVYGDREYVRTLDLPDEFLHDELCRIYLNDDKISTERTSDKLLEIPTDKIFSLIKNGVHTISFSDRHENGQRYVKITSVNKELQLELSQEVCTI